MSDKPNSVWHYTTWPALESILSEGNGSLWASHCLFLNDTQEIHHACDLFARLIGNRVPAGLQSELPTTAEKLLEVFGDVCVTSFSGCPDDLSQWRAYGNSGSPFALVFDFEKMSLVNFRNKAQWVKCVYHQVEQEKKLNELLDQYLAQVNIPNVNADAVSADARANLIDAFIELAPSFKKLKFSAEEEWRLVVTPRRPPKRKRFKFHPSPSRSLIVPHCELELPLNEPGSPLQSICVGPGPHMDLTEKSIRLLLEEKGLKNVEVLKSAVPYRNW